MLSDFLASRLAAPAAWHCSTLPADWCLALGHPDFAERWRGISDPGLCEAVPRDAGGLLVLWCEGIGDALPIVDQPQAGDIGVISMGGHDAGALFDGERWAVQGARTLHFVSPDAVTLLRAWRP